MVHLSNLPTECEIIVTTLPVLGPLLKLQVLGERFSADGLGGRSVPGRAVMAKEHALDEQPLSQGRFIYLNSDGVVADYERRNEGLAASAAATAVTRLAREDKARKAYEAQRKAKKKKLVATVKCWTSLMRIPIGE